MRLAKNIKACNTCSHLDIVNNMCKEDICIPNIMSEYKRPRRKTSDIEYDCTGKRIIEEA